MVTARHRLTDADVGRVRERVARLVEEYHLPGISVGVVQDDDLVYAEGFGFADIESGRPQDPSLRQRIGSITKTMVGLCAMRLVEEERLSLDARVMDLLPDVTLHGDAAAAVTIRHLMTHTGGIGEAPAAEQLRDPEQALWMDTGDFPGVPVAYPDGVLVEVEPGTKWAYANHGWVLLGEIIARAEGTPIEEVLRRRILEPLGMTDSDCLDRPREELSTGYHRAPAEDLRELLTRAGRAIPDETPADGHNIRGRYQYVRGPAAGAVQSTIPDMARYASALLRESRGIVRAETFREMVAPQWRPDDRLISIGLAFFRRPLFGRHTFGHGGGVVGGWNTHITVIPEDSLAVLTHLNLTFDEFAQVDDSIVQAVLDAPDVRVETRETDPALLSAAPGVYEAPAGALTNFRTATSVGRIQISERDGGLVLHARRGRWKRGVRMLPADATDPALFALDLVEAQPPLVALIRDRDGRVTGLRFDRLVEMQRTEQVEPWA